MSDSTLQFPLLLVFTILALVAVLVIAWFAIRFLANLNNVNAGTLRPVKILHTMAVGSRERLVLINYQGRDILLGVTAGGISVIEKTDPNKMDQIKVDHEKVDHEKIDVEKTPPQ